MNNEKILMESKSAREDAMVKVTDERSDEILKKVKGLVFLSEDYYISIDMASQYYEVDTKLIEYHIKENKDELESDGLKVLKGEDLKDFMSKVCDIALLGDKNISKIRSLTVIPRRAMLRLGMLIQKSEIAQQVRTYLLNVESNSDMTTKLISISQETNNAISILQNDMNNLKQINSCILTENEELKTTTYTLINKIDQLLNQPIFKLYENSSSAYEKLLIEFTDVMKEKQYIKNNHVRDYQKFNEEFSIWTGVDFGNKKLNKKDYWINYYGIEIIQHFVYGIKQGTIIKNKNGKWIDKNGIYNNKVEWIRTLKEFDNKCAYCGDDNILMAEHMINQSSDNTSNCVGNIVPSCKCCNDRKLDIPMRDWIILLLKEGTLSKSDMNKIANHRDTYTLE